MLFEAIKEQKRNHTLWTEILEAIRAKEKGITANNALNKLSQSRKRVKRRLSHWRKVRIVQALEELEKVHREQNKTLTEENKDIKNSGLDRVLKMQEQIQRAKESLNIEDNLELGLLDQPNSEGNTLIHLTTKGNDYETTAMLLGYGANPKVEDPQGNTPLHILCSDALKQNQQHNHASALKCASVLLKKGADFSKNLGGSTPQIEVFFTKENDDQMTSELVDGLVRRVQANQLGKQQALKLLIPGNKSRRLLFHLAKGSNWPVIEKWASESGMRIDKIVLRLDDLGLEKMVAVARDGHLQKERVHAMLCKENAEGAVFLSRLELKSQQEVAIWNQSRTNQVAHKMSPEFLRWLLQEVREERWNGETLGEAFCQLNSENKLKLLTVDEELQRQIAVLNKTSTCHSAPLLGSRMQLWLYQEAVAGRWDRDQVFRVIDTIPGGTAVCATMTNLGKM